MLDLNGQPGPSDRSPTHPISFPADRISRISRAQDHALPPQLVQLITRAIPPSLLRSHFALFTMPNAEERTDGAPVSQTAAAPPSNAPKPDRLYYTWSNLFSILAGNATPDVQRKYLEERDELMEEKDCKRCEDHRDYLLQYSTAIHHLYSTLILTHHSPGPTVVFLKDEITKAGGDLNSKNIICRRCTTQQSGGFTPKHGILLCANHMRGRSQIEDTMAHEMVHAWDYLKWKVDDNNLRHQACLEIRASTLSGECRFTREFFGRNQWKVTEQLQACVRRRAALSMLARPGIKDDVHAAKVVNEVWESCFNDPRPFDEIYR